MRTLGRALLVALPWVLRRPLLIWLYGYSLHRACRIDRAWVFPKTLTMKAGARIGAFTVVKGLNRLELGEHARIGRLNWISAYPSDTPPHFMHLPERRPELVLGDHAAITNRHIVDCTEHVRIGRFSTVAGFRSQILTHSIDLGASRQDAKAITIGDYCFVGTASTLLGGSALPDFSVLAAHSLLNDAYSEPRKLYAGVPAKPIGAVAPDWKYFSRSRGFVT